MPTVRPSESILARLKSEKDKLWVKQETLERQPAIIKRLKNAAKKYEDLAYDPKNKFSNGDRLKQNKKAAQLRLEEGRLIDLPKEIKDVEQQIKSIKEQYSQTKTYEDKIDRQVSQLTQHIDHTLLTSRSGQRRRRKGYPPEKRAARRSRRVVRRDRLRESW